LIWKYYLIKKMMNISNKLKNFLFQDMAERKGPRVFHLPRTEKKLHTTSKLELDCGMLTRDSLIGAVLSAHGYKGQVWIRRSNRHTNNLERGRQERTSPKIFKLELDGGMLTRDSMSWHRVRQCCYLLKTNI
jgi:hypothetical protein